MFALSVIDTSAPQLAWRRTPTWSVSRRGMFAVLTDRGLEVLRSAAPEHLRGVRDNLIDLLSDQERRVLAEIFERVLSHLRARQPTLPRRPVNPLPATFDRMA